MSSPVRIIPRLSAGTAAATDAQSGFAASSVGLSGSPTCGEYMNASEQEQRQVVSQLAGKYKGVWATPLGFPGVAYYCASHPTTTLDEFFASASSY